VRETCKHRPSQCVALLAEWTQEVPVSERREEILRWIRGNPILSRLVPLELLEPLAALHAVHRGGDPIPLATARTSAELFARHYHHAAPFSHAALDRIWQRCEADASQAHRCAEVRGEIEGRVGDAEAAIGRTAQRTGAPR
jgi:hypothetical protein